MDNIDLLKTDIKNLLGFVEANDSNPVPYCFTYVMLIEKNIKIWESEGQQNSEELKACIISDWRSAKSRAGLYDYYIARDDFNDQRQLNNKLNELIERVNFFIVDILEDS